MNVSDAPYGAKQARQVGALERFARSTKIRVRLWWLGSSIRGAAYRFIMRLAHRFDWHYAPVFGPFMCEPGDPREGKRQRWCQWCGFRAWVIEPDPSSRLSGATTESARVGEGE